MVAWPNPAVPLLLAAALLAFEDWVTTPSCSGGPPAAHGTGELRAMMVADLMLLGSDATYADRFFRDHVMHKVFANSIQALKPDMIVVLGDISAKGSELTERKWISVIEQFEGILGHHSSIPLLVALGDKDVGSCANLEGKFVHRKAKHLPGLDSFGCGAFEISNVSFVSLNAVALLCENNDLRFGVEKFMERESYHFQRLKETEWYPLACEKRVGSADIGWRRNSMESGSGPVILLHFPLHRFDAEVTGVPTSSESEAVGSDHSSVFSSSKQSMGIYDRLHTLPANSTQYILQALKPRIIFNAHTGSFSDFLHADGTREVTVPAMTWKTRGLLQLNCHIDLNERESFFKDLMASAPAQSGKLVCRSPPFSILAQRDPCILADEEQGLLAASAMEVGDGLRCMVVPSWASCSPLGLLQPCCCQLQVYDVVILFGRRHLTRLLELESRPQHVQHTNTAHLKSAKGLMLFLNRRKHFACAHSDAFFYPGNASKISFC